MNRQKRIYLEIHVTSRFILCCPGMHRHHTTIKNVWLRRSLDQRRDNIIRSCYICLDVVVLLSCQRIDFKLHFTCYIFMVESKLAPSGPELWFKGLFYPVRLVWGGNQNVASSYCDCYTFSFGSP